MLSLDKLVGSVQSLVGERSQEAACKSGVIVRRRKFSPTTLACTFILGFLRNPRARDEELAQVAGVLGVHVTTQAVEQRYSMKLVEFLKELFLKAVLESSVPAERVLAPLLERFSDVCILDSTVIALPAELAEEYPGCGGSHGGTAAMKLQTYLSLKFGNLHAVRIEAGRDCDMKTPLQQQPPQANSLRITDLGYFNTQVLEQFSQQQAWWLSPLLVGTNVYDHEGSQIDVLTFLNDNGPIVDASIRIGAKRKVAARIIAWRLPETVANRRRQKIRESARKKGRSPSAERLARCDWGILVTNLPVEKLSFDEARVLYRSRWQIELLFKRWKSQGRVADATEESVTRRLVKLWSRLLAIVLQQWLQTGVWGRPEISLKKAWDVIQSFALPIAMNVSHAELLRTTLQQLFRVTQSTIRKNKRKQPSTFELLINPKALPYALT